MCKHDASLVSEQEACEPFQCKRDQPLPCGIVLWQSQANHHAEASSSSPRHKLRNMAAAASKQSPVQCLQVKAAQQSRVLSVISHQQQQQQVVLHSSICWSVCRQQLLRAAVRRGAGIAAVAAVAVSADAGSSNKPDSKSGVMQVASCSGSSSSSRQCQSLSTARKRQGAAVAASRDAKLCYVLACGSIASAMAAAVLGFVHCVQVTNCSSGSRQC